jgi:uncharacterized membrane protein YgcG
MDDFIDRIEWPPFLFHYIIVFVCAVFITCVCILKFKYLYWYSQPITFRFTIRRFGSGGGGGGWNTSIMNPLSLAERCNNAIVYPFLHFVQHDLVRVYGSRGDLLPLSDAPYEKIAEFLSQTPAASDTRYIPRDARYIPRDVLEFILSQDTYGLSVFIGILGGNTPADIKGVCVLTPRIMLSFGQSSSSSPRSVSIYVCEHLACAKYITTERESLELLETTEYIQKSREIAGEQTLYRYHEIPWFVIPFTTVYSYTFALTAPAPAKSLGRGVSIVQVSTANFAIFYAFVNERVREFRTCILHELTALQSLVQGGVYRIYMLLFNQVRVIAAYIFAPSWMKVREGTVTAYTRHTTKPKKTIGNRIAALHNHISRTSTAVVKYLPPAVRPKYDALGKRVKRGGSGGGSGGGGGGSGGGGDDILRLLSSIQHNSLCDRDTFVQGFSAAVYHLSRNNTNVICIDTIAHNYRIIDGIIASTSAAAMGASSLLSREKWYYILYNAIIHRETPCKDILVI